MSKMIQTAGFLSAVMFSLSWLPGFSSENVSAQADFSSSAVAFKGECDFRYQASCEAESPDSKTTANVKVNRVKRDKRVNRLAGPDQSQPNGEQEEVFEVSVEASASVEGCTTGCSRTSTVTRHFPISDLSRINAKALEVARAETERLRVQAAKDAAKLRLIEQCVQDEAGRKLEGSEKVRCLMNRIAALDPEKAAKFYDQNLKSILVDMLKSEVGQERKDGQRLLAQLQQLVGNNPYLKESLKDMIAFARHSEIVNTRAAQLEELQRRLGVNHPQAQLLEGQLKAYLAQTGRYFSDRGLELNNRVQALTGWDYQGTWSQDLSNFQQQLQQIYSQHNQNINAANNGFQQRPFSRSTGTTSVQAPTGSQPVINNPSLRPIGGSTVPARPGVPAATGGAVRGPVYGQKVGGR